VKRGKRWTAVSYLWNEAGDDAVLAPAERQVLHLGERDWLVPSRSDCLGCHSRAANFVLSLTSSQLHREVQAGNARRNQLTEFIARGLLTARPNIVRATTPLADPRNVQAPLADRAQSYLAVNCAHCHMPDGGGNSSMNFAVPMKSPRQQLVDARPEHGDFGLPDARLVAPGATDRSVLPIRIVMRGDGQMPPLGTLQPDPEGVELLTRWIESLGR
jgi:mono/diheme cytochrome c family protein